jgi:type IV fimbrial biogenesis protein FimT
VAPGGATRVSFDGLGRRTANIDASAPIDSVDLDLPTTVLPAEKSRDLRVQLGLGGQIVLCDPNVNAADDVRRCP